MTKMTQAQQERRLERVEEKLDKLTEAIVTIARIEERVNTVLKNSNFFEVFFEPSILKCYGSRFNPPIRCFYRS